MRSNDLNARKIIVIIISAIVLIVLFGVAVHLFEEHGLLDEQFGDKGDWGASDDDEILFSFNDKDYISHDDVDIYLIAGTDTGSFDKGEMYRGDMADFITVLIADNTTEKCGFYQIDRNTIIDMMIPDEDGEIMNIAPQQICVAHWYGRNDEERDESLMSAVPEALGGLEPDGYFIMSMEDIDKLNDAMGGVTVSMQEDLTDLDPAFKKGATVKLSGEQAEEFLRARSGVGEGTNAERMSRHRQYMESAYTMLTDQLRENPEYINDLFDQLQSVLRSDSRNKISEITNQVVTYSNEGILSFEGETRIADTMGEGIEHEEFYQDEQSVLDELRKVMTIEEDKDTDEE